MSCLNQCYLCKCPSKIVLLFIPYFAQLNMTGAGGERTLYMQFSSLL